MFPEHRTHLPSARQTQIMQNSNFMFCQWLFITLFSHDYNANTLITFSVVFEVLQMCVRLFFSLSACEQGTV